MESLPSSIELYLSEAGFSGTELIVLNKLLQEDALTLRELASKTGKSTGVLDQAVKKLIKKRILAKETINETPKYVLKSLQSILEWMEDDINLKQEMLVRKHQNFETFVRSITISKNRPQMEYFEGEKGMKKAYIQLIEHGNDIVQYGPTNYSAPEDPLREFFVQLFRERRKRGIFARVITHNTPLGRKYQSRDPFEYRKTILVDQNSYPFLFEKIIIGNTVACFQLEDKKACFIRYPELAENERHFFERIWNKKISNEQSNDSIQEIKRSSQRQKAPVPFQTKTLSQLREFFLGRKSVATFAIFSFTAVLITYGLYRQNLTLNSTRIRDQALSIAASSTIQFNPDDLHELQRPLGLERPEYKNIIYQMNEILRQNPSIRNLYIIQPIAGNPEEWELVVNADSLDPYSKIGLSENGIFNAIDRLSPLGGTYGPISSKPSIYEAYITKKPAASKTPHTDGWGTFISGSGPIIQDGKVIAILTIDIDVSRILLFTENIFTPILWFFGFFLLFVFIRLAAFNRSLFKELCEQCNNRKLFIMTGTCAALSLVITIIGSQYIEMLMFKRIQDRVLAIAITGAQQFDANKLRDLQHREDWHKDNWKNAGIELNNIRKQNKDVIFAYIFRKSDEDPNMMEFVADADSINPLANIDEDPVNDIDMNRDGKIDGSVTGGDFLAWPTQIFPTAPKEAFDAYLSPTTTKEIYEDQWGPYISGYAPIKDQNGRTEAVLAIDISPDTQKEISNTNFSITLTFGIFFILFGLIAIIWSMVRSP